MTETTLPKEEETKSPSVVATPPVQKMHILICYHEDDVKHIGDLDRHMQLMYRRLGNRNRHYFCYQTISEPKQPDEGDSQYFKDLYKRQKAAYEDYKTRRASFFRYLRQEKLLLLLYVSNAFMERLWKDMDENPELKDLLTNPNHRVIPVLISPTAGLAAENCQPLCSYEGTAFEVACQHLAANIESIAREYFGDDIESSAVTPFTVLASPRTVQAMPLSETDRTQMFLTEALGSFQAMFEQSNTRVVEAQQLAISERVIREESEADLRRQVGEMKEMLQTWQNATMAAKLRRLFGSSK
jgi:hypothetical protein